MNNYLNQNFSREARYRAVFISFWNHVNADAYILGNGTADSELLWQCRTNTSEVLNVMEDADTAICFIPLDGQLYMARNLLDSHFEPYATVVMVLDPGAIFQPLYEIQRISDKRICLDQSVFSLSDQGALVALAEESAGARDICCETEVDGHSLAFMAKLVAYNPWEETPGLHWSVVAVALMGLPLLIVVIALFYHHITRPMETLAQANLLVQSGERGYEIRENPPNSEFSKLYAHFNAMSTELKNQFERSYLEQQASQQAQIKALQSQINPHFLNNTLEIINWEARMEGNDRVSAMIEALSTMLGAALDRDGRTQIPLKEELGYVDAYLYIIRERLGDGFHVYEQIDQSVLSGGLLPGKYPYRHRRGDRCHVRGWGSGIPH